MCIISINLKTMKITWVTRSFLDYRVPVYQELDKLCGNNLSLIFNGDVVPESLTDKMRNVLGSRCLPLKGEKRLIGKAQNPISSSKKNGSRIPIQPGLYKALKASEPDAIITDGFFQWTFPCIIYKMFHRSVKHVMCYEGWHHTERNVGKLNTLYRKFAKFYMDRICCNGTLSRDYIMSLGYPDEKISLGNMAADTQFFKKESERISEEEKAEFRKKNHLNELVYVFSGRLVQLKGIAELLEAWAFFTKGKEQEVSLLLIGDGPEKESLEKYCLEKNLTNVVLVGKISYSNLPLYYSSSSVFVIPTLQDNWSLVVPEAMSCSLPVLCSVYNGCWPELVRDDNGWTFDPLDRHSTLEKLNESYRQRHAFDIMGKRSSELVEKFSPGNVAATIFSSCKQK